MSLTGDECIPIKLCKNIFIKDILKQDKDLDTKNYFFSNDEVQEHVFFILST